AQLPNSVRTIKYVTQPHSDHRTAIDVLEEIGAAVADRVAHGVKELSIGTPTNLKSAHVMYEVYPPGTWQTSQSIGLSTGQQVVVGPGFSNDELPTGQSRAMHDLLVGLIGFDRVYVPLNALGRVHDIAGSVHFWHLVESDAISFVNWRRHDGVLYVGAESISGGILGSYAFRNPDGSAVTPAHVIREQLKARPGFEREAERRFVELE